ncbi:hypothetical protein V6Z12_A13G048300 [Gossypium hirsutum]
MNYSQSNISVKTPTTAGYRRQRCRDAEILWVNILFGFFG